MGTKCALLVAVLVLLSYESLFLNIIKLMLLKHLILPQTIDNHYFDEMVTQIYPTARQLN